MTATKARREPAVTVPMVFTVEEMVEHFAFAPGYPSPEEVKEARYRLGRNSGPALLFDLYAWDLLTPDAAAANIGDVWSAAEYPDSYIDHAGWRALFEHAGYTHNGLPASRPSRAVILYRGSVPERRADWSWTDEMEVAIGYAQGTRARRPDTGTVWTATVEPWRLLARTEGPGSRGEQEYVVDTDGLLIAAHVVEEAQS